MTGVLVIDRRVLISEERHQPIRDREERPLTNPSTPGECQVSTLLTLPRSDEP